MSGNLKRNYGIDLFRIIAALMVLTIHILGQGGIIDLFPQESTQFRVGWLIQCGVYCAVNCFALMSGYVGVSSKFKYSSILKMWLQVVFCGVIPALVVRLIFPDKVTDTQITKAFFPVFNNKYWYYTAYFALSFFMPALNHLLNTLPKEKLRLTVLFSFILLSVLPTVFKKDLFQTSNGFSFLWLMTLYLFGGYIAKHYTQIDGKSRRMFLWGILVYLVMVLVSWWNKLHNFTLPEDAQGINLVRYTSPTIVLAAVALLVAFANCPVKRGGKVLSFVSQFCFSIYLIHSQGVIYNNFIHHKNGHLADYSTAGMVWNVLLLVLFWFVLCAAVDFVRLKLFQLLRVNQFCNWLEKFVREKILRKTLPEKETL